MLFTPLAKELSIAAMRSFSGPEQRDPAGMLMGSSTAMGTRTRVVEQETEPGSAASQ